MIVYTSVPSEDRCAAPIQNFYVAAAGSNRRQSEHFSRPYGDERVTWVECCFYIKLMMGSAFGNRQNHILFCKTAPSLDDIENSNDSLIFL